MKRILPLFLLLAGCSNAPIVDMKGVDKRQYRTDLAECREYAEQVRTGQEAAKGGAIGAVIGGAIGAAIGNSDTAERIAGAGAVSGASKGAARAEYRKERVVRNCLKGRGYKVLD